MKRFFPRPWLAGLLCTLALPAWAAFTDNGDGTITDTTTGLMWDKCSRGQVWDNTTPPGTCTGAPGIFTWEGALVEATVANTPVANTPSHRNFTDWRLPNRTELESLVKIDASAPAIDGTVFPATASAWYWTSTTYAPNPAYAWFVFFDNGNSFASHKTLTFHVRLVRSGQWFGAFDALDAAPALSALGVTGTTSTATTLQATSNEAATGYWIAVPQGSAAPTAAQVKAGVGYGAVTLAAAGNGAMAAAVQASFAITGLTASTPYTLYLVAEDGNSNLSTPPVSIDVTTQAPAVNGACGSDHGVAVLAAPSASLCSAGVAGSVTSAAAAFTWSCAGTGGGSAAACSAPRQYNVTPTAGAGGSISPGTAQAVTYNASTSFTVTPSSGYGISTVSGCGGSLAGNTYTTGAVTTNCTVSASFSLLPPSTYPIHIAASAGGSVVCSPNPVPHGSNATCTATASSGYRFTGWGGSCSGSASPCTLTNVTAATNVSAQFAPASAQAIPTLGEWAMLLLTGLMGLGAMVALRRR